MELQKELVRLLAEEKLNFRMWSSNCTTLMNSIPTEDYPYQTDTTQSKKVKILCLVCDPNCDQFSICLRTITITEMPTKRTLLSEHSKIYDPLDIVSPFTVLMKIVI